MSPFVCIYICFPYLFQQLSSRQATGEVDVWFVLLEKPDVTGPVLTPRPQLMMADAYKLLHDITHKHNVSVKLDLSPKKKLVSKSLYFLCPILPCP